MVRPSLFPGGSQSGPQSALCHAGTAASAVLGVALRGVRARRLPPALSEHDLQTVSLLPLPSLRAGTHVPAPAPPAQQIVAGTRRQGNARLRALISIRLPYELLNRWRLRSESRCSCMKTG